MDRPRSASGARPSRSWSPTAASAWCTAPRSCSSPATGRTRCTRRSWPASGCRRRPCSPRWARRCTSSASCTGCAARPTRRRRAYRQASECGHYPQPGLALLRVTQGRLDAAVAAIRACGRGGDRPAAPGADARGVRRDRARRRRRRRSPGRGRRADRHRRRTSPRRRCAPWRRTRAGRCCSPRATPAGALEALREAAEAWRGLQARYDGARTRALVGLARRALGDDDTAQLELDGARTVFVALGAAPTSSGWTGWSTATERGRRGRPEPARARGAPAGRDRPDQPRDRSRAGPEREDGRPAREQHLRQARAVRRARPPPPTPTSTTWSERADEQNYPSPRRSDWVLRPKSGPLPPRLASRADEKEVRPWTPSAGRGRRTSRPSSSAPARPGSRPATTCAKRGPEFVILDSYERVGDNWRCHWDSLRLYSPALAAALPGMPFPAPRTSYPTKDEMADFLEAYRERFDLPVRGGVRVSTRAAATASATSSPAPTGRRTRATTWWSRPAPSAGRRACRPSPASWTRRSGSCTPATTSARRSCSPAACSSSGRRTRAATSPSRPASAGHPVVLSGPIHGEIPFRLERAGREGRVPGPVLPRPAPAHACAPRSAARSGPRSARTAAR